MTRRSTQSTPTTPKHTQRERLLAAAIDVVAHKGYSAATIAQIVRQAGVSRPTFYDYFADKQACVLAVLATVNGHLVAQARTALAGEPPSHASHAAIRAIVEFCNSAPAMAQVSINSSLTGTPDVIDARYDGIAAIAGAIDDSHGRVPVATPTPDVASDLLIGGIFRLLGSRLRRRQPPDATTLAELVAWVKSYTVPASEHRWATLNSGRLVTTPTVVAEPPFGSAPLARPRSRARRVEHQRQRLLYATAELVREKGLAATTLAEIAKRAGVGHRTFSQFFADKHEAFLALHELGCRRALAHAVGAFSPPGPWPERLWAAGEACSEYVGRNPSLAHVTVVEPYAAGPSAATHMDEVLRTFTLFLNEGYACVCAPRPSPSDTACEAIAATIFDLAYRECRLGKSAELPRLLPQAMLLALAPFLGHQQAVRFIDGRLTRQGLDMAAQRPS